MGGFSKFQGFEAGCIHIYIIIYTGNQLAKYMFIIVFMFCLLVCFGPWNLKRWETMFYFYFCKCSEPLPTYGGFLWIFPSNSWKVWLGWLGGALDGQDQRIRRIYSLIHLFGRVESPNMGTQQPGGFHESSCGAWFFLSTQEIRLGNLPNRPPGELPENAGKDQPERTGM